jgi:hypothetical protein
MWLAVLGAAGILGATVAAVHYYAPVEPDEFRRILEAHPAMREYRLQIVVDQKITRHEMATLHERLAEHDHTVCEEFLSWEPKPFGTVMRQDSRPRPLAEGKAIATGRFGAVEQFSISVIHCYPSMQIDPYDERMVSHVNKIADCPVHAAYGQADRQQ